MVHKLIFCFTFLSAFISFAVAQNDTVYMFSYFKDNGEDGLHLAYSEDGYTFTALKNDSSFLTPVLSKDKLMRDPCIIRGGDNLFHMVWTVSWNDTGIGYATSPDLIHWSKQQYIPVMQREPGALNCWAPEIFYDSKEARYVLYWATSIPGRFPKSDNSGDEKYNHRMYYTTTKDFVTFSTTTLLYDKGFNVIDATIQYDGRKYIMFLKDETKNPVPQKNIRVAVSDNVSSGYSNPSKPVTGKYWAEGPTAIKAGNQWVVYFDKYMDHQYGAVVSSDLIQWKDISDRISFPKGTRHGTVFTITKKEFQTFFAK